MDFEAKLAAKKEDRQEEALAKKQSIEMAHMMREERHEQNRMRIEDQIQSADRRLREQESDKKQYISAQKEIKDFQQKNRRIYIEAQFEDRGAKLENLSKEQEFKQLRAHEVISETRQMSLMIKNRNLSARMTK